MRERGAERRGNCVCVCVCEQARREEPSRRRGVGRARALVGRLVGVVSPAKVPLAAAAGVV